MDHGGAGGIGRLHPGAGGTRCHHGLGLHISVFVAELLAVIKHLDGACLPDAPPGKLLAQLLKQFVKAVHRDGAADTQHGLFLVGHKDHLVLFCHNCSLHAEDVCLQLPQALLQSVYLIMGIQPAAVEPLQKKLLRTVQQLPHLGQRKAVVLKAADA